MSDVTRYIDDRMEELTMRWVDEELAKNDSQLSIRIPQGLNKDLTGLAEYLETSKSAVVQMFLHISADEAKRHAAQKDPKAARIFGFEGMPGAASEGEE